MSDTEKKLKRAEEFLDSIPKFSSFGKHAANFDLSRMRNFCEKMGNPQHDFKSIHVGGTNGKGTVSRMLASIYQEAEYKTGLYTSPHLVNVKERFRINSKMIENELLVEFFDLYEDYIRKTGCTYFEITTAIAFWYFSREQVDIAILEVGLGGRLDATNVIEPIISVITSISLDHTDVLGNSVEEIALEKAGIIKPGKPVVIGDLSNIAEEVILSVAQMNDSNVIKSGSPNAYLTNKKIKLTGIEPAITLDTKHWKKVDHLNVAIVCKIVETLNSEYPVPPYAFKNGIKSIHSKFSQHAVFEKLFSDKLWYFDGAHNEESVKSLTDHLLSLAPSTRWSVVLSFMGDKLNARVAELWNLFPNIYLYEMEGDRAASVDEMKKFFPTAKVVENHRFLEADQFKSELVIFSGSFYFYSIVSNWMGAIASADQKNPSAL